MIDETVKHNWVEVALKQWDALIQGGTILPKHKPNRQLLTGLLGLMFTNEKLLASGQNWVDLSSVTSENLFSSQSRDLIFRRIDKGHSGRTGVRKIAFECLRSAYEEEFDIDKALPKYQVAKRARVHQKKPAQYNLVEEWQKATLSVLENDPKFDDVDLPETEAVQSRIESIIGALEEEFGAVSYKRFVTDDDIMDATDDLLEAADENAKDLADRHIIKAMQIAVTKLPSPRR